MAEVKTWTVEQIEAEADGWVYARTRLMLRAFAAQTRQVEAMRKLFSGICDNDKPGGYFGNEGCEVCGHDHSAHVKKKQFTALFPKDGAQ